MTLELVPQAEGFDQEAVRELLLEHDGNVTQVAKQLRVRPERLRAYVQAVPALRKTMDEVLEQGVDKAISILFEALRDESSFLNRYYAAKEFLRCEAGRRRGFGPRENAALEIKSGPSTLTIKWIDPPKEE